MSIELDALQCSFDDILISDLIVLLRNLLPERNFTATEQAFYHDIDDAGEVEASHSIANDTRRQCGDRCLLDVHEFVLQEVSTSFKECIDVFSSMLNGDLRLDALRNFGFAPVYNTLVKIRLHQSPPDSGADGGGLEGGGVEGGGEKVEGEDEGVEDEADRGGRQDSNVGRTIGRSDYRIEAGGGSGMGFQLLCDSVTVLTAGGGGGGGIEGSMHNLNFGGGGGGGIQFAENCLFQPAVTRNSDSEENDENSSGENSSGESEWSSIGGGGGCGSFNNNQNNNTDVTNISSQGDICGSSDCFICGGTPDKNSITKSRNGTAIKAAFDLFFNGLSESCGVLEVIGGGGGGGGTAECTVPYMIGYGFSFHLTSGARESRGHGMSETARTQRRKAQTEKALSSKSKHTKVLKASKSVALHSTTGENPDDGGHSGDLGGRGDQYKYDVAGSLLHDASVVCGGYMDWCCVSAHAGARIRDCLGLLEDSGPEDSRGSGDGPGGKLQDLKLETEETEVRGGRGVRYGTHDINRRRVIGIPLDEGDENNEEGGNEGGGNEEDEEGNNGGNGYENSSTSSCNTIIASKERILWLLSVDSCTRQNSNSNSTITSRGEGDGDEKGDNEGISEGDSDSSIEWIDTSTWSMVSGNENSGEQKEDKINKFKKIEKLQSCLNRKRSKVSYVDPGPLDSDITWATYSTEITSKSFLLNNTYVLTDLIYTDMNFDFTVNGTDRNCSYYSNVAGMSFNGVGGGFYLISGKNDRNGKNDHNGENGYNAINMTYINEFYTTSDAPSTSILICFLFSFFIVNVYLVFIRFIMKDYDTSRTS